MRRQDLRKLDRNLILSVLLWYCFLSFLFLLLSWFSIINPLEVSLTMYLWISFSMLILIVIGTFIFTKTPKLRWTKPPKDIKVLEEGKYKLEQGKSYYIKEPKNEKSLEVFHDALQRGVAALCLTRNNPRDIKKLHDFDHASIHWLTELDSENSINPLDLEEITYTIQQYLQKISPHSVILLDGLEYLISFVGFSKVLHLIQDLRDMMALHGSVLLVPISDPTLALSSSKLLEKELEAIPI